MTTWLLALGSIALSVAAQFLLKTGMSAVRAAGQGGWQPVATNPWVLGGFALYGLGAIVWLKVLAEWDVSRAYPLVGLGFVLTAVVGAVLGEQVGVARVAGIALIAAGVVLVGRSA